MTGPVLPWSPPKRRRGAKPRPRTYVDERHNPPYSQDRLRWPSALLGTYRRADQAGETDNTEDT